MLGFFKQERQMSFNYSYKQITGTLSINVSSKLSNLHTSLRSVFGIYPKIVLFLHNQENPDYKVELTEDILESLKTYTSTLVDNLEYPWSIAFLPNKDIFLSELTNNTYDKN